MEIYQLKKQGFKIRRIAKKLGVSRTTVYKYLSRSPEEMSEWMASTSTRTKKLDPYEMVIQTWLSEYPDLSGAQVHDWLKEHYKEFPVCESSVRNYVRELREKYQIPKVETKRQYEAFPDPPMGQQVQVDFGKTNQKTTVGKTCKLMFISFVLSHSRYKYIEWLDRPFTTKDVIRAHENAFQFYGGIPHELVYDQDAVLVVSENAGDLILTSGFQAYKQERNLTFFVCRRADPESKGRIENVVGFIKQNFAKNRVFNRLDQWNEQCAEWLIRTGNGRVHNTTKKRPIEVFALEKQHLRPVTRKLIDSTIESSISRTVRKDNTIIYLSNRYSVPLGTYQKDSTVIIEATSDQQLLIREEKESPVIAKHLISLEKGKLVQETSHKRDRSKGISAYQKSLSSKFKDREKALYYLNRIHQRFPRYIRDQLQIISRVVESDPELMNEVLEECLHQEVYSATEFRDMMIYKKKEKQKKPSTLNRNDFKPLKGRDDSLLEEKTYTRNVQEYVALLEGGDVS